MDNPNFRRFKYKLSPGWIFGRLIDNSDAQYRGFRDRLPLATFIFAAYVIVHQALLRLLKDKSVKVKYGARATAACIGICALHGFNAIKIFGLLAINYAIGKTFAGNKFASSATWLYALACLAILEYGRLKWSNWLGSWFEFLDEYTGIVHRWDITFNISVLRMISYNIDLHYSKNINPTELLKHHGSCEACKIEDCEKYRSMVSPEPEVYNALSYLSYVLYLPLFMAGPIISFNNFAYQVERPTKNINKRFIIKYGLRVLAILLTFEVMLHFMWVVAIKDTASWIGFTGTQYAGLGLFNLFVVWLKLMIIWRFFRFFALCDGVETPENMNRCIVNNYSGFGFWRAWHRSFNLWIIRYMYIPMGGSKTSAWNVWPIFTFVALWHDFELKMLVWGWLVAIFLLPELIATWYAKRIDLESHHHYRYIRGVAGGLNLLQITVCNLLGFVLGIDGTKELFRTVFSVKEIPFFICLFSYYYAKVQIAFEIREEERRRGIFKNY